MSNRLLPLAALSLLGISLTTVAGAQGAYTDGQAAQLKGSDVKKLKALQAPIAVPTYVPAGYKLKAVRSEINRLGNFWIVDYGLTYENAKGDTFFIESANEGIGDALIVAVLQGNNHFFDGRIQVGPPDLTAQGGEVSEREVGSQWIDSKPAYVPTGARSRRQHYRLDGEGLSKKEAFKIMLSLRYLR